MKFLSFFLGLIMLGAAALSYHLYHGNIPESYLPWEPIDLSAQPGLFTEYKISKLSDDTQLCHNALERAGINYTPLDDREAGTCTLTDQVSLTQSRYPYSAPVRGQCALTAAIALWENQVLKPLAKRHFNSDIQNITHYGIFSCRSIRGNSSRLSQHATANAIDIAAFRLKDGTTISVLQDWNDTGAKGQFLKDVHNQSCAIFKGVLGPNYNALHKDHFHLDLGRWNICR